MVERTTVSPDGMKYTFTLRDGLRWHDGQAVRSEDCVESLKRWGKKDRFGQLLMAHTAKIAPVDKKTFTLDARRALRPRARGARKAVEQRALHDAGADRVHLSEGADQGDRGLRPVQVRQGRVAPGHQAVYVRNRDYIPRNETPSGSTGGKKAYLDKVIWRYMPDPGRPRRPHGG